MRSPVHPPIGATLVYIREMLENLEKSEFLPILFSYLLGLYTRSEARNGVSGMFSSGSIEQSSPNGPHSTLRSLGEASKELKIRVNPNKSVNQC